MNFTHVLVQDEWIYSQQYQVCHLHHSDQIYLGHPVNKNKSNESDLSTKMIWRVLAEFLQPPKQNFGNVSHNPCNSLPSQKAEKIVECALVSDLLLSLIFLSKFSFVQTKRSNPYSSYLLRLYIKLSERFVTYKL